jgi:hypothetical protein
MRRIEVLFLLSVLAAAAAFAARTISETVRVSGWESGGEVSPGTAGQPRDVDLEKIRRLIREGHLSDREALFAVTRGEDGRRLFRDPGEIVRVRFGEEFALAPGAGARMEPLPEGLILVSGGETVILKAAKAGEAKVVFGGGVVFRVMVAGP